MQPDTAHLNLPFFDDAHRELASGLLPWIAAQEIDESDDRAACRALVPPHRTCQPLAGDGPPHEPRTQGERP